MSDPEPEQSSRTAEDASTEHSGFASRYDETGQHIIGDVKPGAPSGSFSIVAAKNNFMVTVDGSGYKIIQEGNCLIIENTLVEQEVVTNRLPREGDGAWHEHDKLDGSKIQTEETFLNVEESQSQIEITREAPMRPKDGEEDMWQWLHALDTTQRDVGQSETALAQSPLGPAPTETTVTTSVSTAIFDFTVNQGGGRRYLRDELLALRRNASTRVVESSTWQPYLETLLQSGSNQDRTLRSLDIFPSYRVDVEVSIRQSSYPLQVLLDQAAFSDQHLGTTTTRWYLRHSTHACDRFHQLRPRCCAQESDYITESGSITPASLQDQHHSLADGINNHLFRCCITGV